MIAQIKLKTLSEFNTYLNRRGSGGTDVKG
jgi:hypothetical protein